MDVSRAISRFGAILLDLASIITFMTIRREPPSDPLSVLLLPAIGDLLRDTGASRIHPDDIAVELGNDPVASRP